MGEEKKLRENPDSTFDASSYSRRLRSVPSRRWFPTAVLLTGLALTLLATYYAFRTIQIRTRAEFDSASLRARASIRARFAVYDALLHGTAGFIAVEKEITRERFKDYLNGFSVVQNYPSIEDICYAQRVPASDVEPFRVFMSEQGESNFRIWPKTNAADFYPVTFVEPPNPRNEAGVGFDISSEPTRREAMERARDTGQTAVSGKVTLLPEVFPQSETGFLIFCPIYHADKMPATVEERRKQLQGYVFGVFRAGRLFTSITEDEAMGAELELFDSTNTDEANLLFRSSMRPSGPMPFRKTFEETTSLDVSGRTWTARFFAEPAMVGFWAVPLLLITGVVLSLVMFYLTRAEARARRAAETAAVQLKTSEAALRESEERLRKYATELEHRVAERTANLAQSLQSLEGVLYHVAHDLRAPLRSMASFTAILLESYAPQLDEKGKDYAQRISNAAHRMDRLVQDLLAYGRLGHTAVPLSRVNLDAEVKATLDCFSDEIAARGAVVDVSSPLPPVKANAALLNQILSNLLSNALKFSRPELPPRVRIHAEETTTESLAAKIDGMPLPEAFPSAADGRLVRIWVEDNGIGIPPEYHERIFRMFERLHGVGAYPGTGIGLAIVRKGVERMGGRVGVESAPGAGSRFWVELPAA